MYLAALSCGTQVCCSMGDLWFRLVGSGSLTGHPALGARSLSHWTMREVPSIVFLSFIHIVACISTSLLLLLLLFSKL